MVAGRPVRLAPPPTSTPDIPAGGPVIVQHPLATNGHSTSEPPLQAERRHQTSSIAEHVLFEVKRLIVGQDLLLERLLVALLARGHVLLEGVPGLAKTATVKALAQVVGGSFGRVQFT